MAWIFQQRIFFLQLCRIIVVLKYIGTRTAGAGGYVEKFSFPNLSGIE